MPTHSLLDELNQVWRDCQEPGWDGYSARPVTQASRDATSWILASLPKTISLPSIGAEPDGQITLEWYKSPNWVLSVSVDGTGFLHYAGIFGPHKQCGTLKFSSTTSNDLLQLIRRILDAE